MIKLITPIIHVAFLVPTFIITISLRALAAISGISLVEQGLANEIATAVPILIIASGITFYLVNIIIQALEKLPIPTIKDHLRQSAFFYLIILLGIVYIVGFNFKNPAIWLYLADIMVPSIIALAANFIFIKKRRKANIT